MYVDLSRSQPDTRRFVHGFKHVVDQLANFVIDDSHWLGDGAQTRVWKFEDVQNGHMRMCCTVR
ncbi:hypothetical protein D3C76_1432270 [compost metagenome]